MKYPIREAKFIEFSILSHKSWRNSHEIILLVKCDLIDQNFTYTNVKDGDDFDSSNIFNSQIAFIGCGVESGSNDLYKIDESKSLINDFNISISKLDDKIFNADEIEKAFIKIKIYHE